MYASTHIPFMVVIAFEMEIKKQKSQVMSPRNDGEGVWRGGFIIDQLLVLLLPISEHDDRLSSQKQQMLCIV